MSKVKKGKPDSGGIWDQKVCVVSPVTKDILDLKELRVIEVYLPDK